MQRARHTNDVINTQFMRCHSLVSRVGLCSAYSCSRAKQVFLISTSVTS